MTSAGKTRPADDPFVSYLIEALAPWADVSGRRLFGCRGLYWDGCMFALVYAATLFLKDGPDLRTLADGTPLEPFTYTRSNPTGKCRTVSLGYVAVPEDIAADPDTLAAWAEAAWQNARRAAG